MGERRYWLSLSSGLVAFWLAWLPRELLLTPMSAERIDSLVVDKTTWTALTIAFALSVALLVGVAARD